VVSEEWQVVLTTNRRENTIGIFPPADHRTIAKVAVGAGPNGLAYDPSRRIILVANIGDPAVPGSHTLSVVGLDDRAMIDEIPVPGRTRWAVYNPDTEAFYVNIADPPRIVVVAARAPQRIAQAFAIPSAGPHGLDLDRTNHRLFCACDAKVLVTLDVQSGQVQDQRELAGVPDVIFFDQARRRLYVAIGNPGVIEVFDTETMKRVGSVASEKGAHTLTIAPAGDRLYAFLPETHRAAVYRPTEKTP
jgi:DNA-binding beta-propeller fold protein YncE